MTVTMTTMKVMAREKASIEACASRHMKKRGRCQLPAPFLRLKAKVIIIVRR